MMNLSFTPDPRLSLRADCRDSLKKLQCAAQQQRHVVKRFRQSLGGGSLEWSSSHPPFNVNHPPLLSVRIAKIKGRAGRV